MNHQLPIGKEVAIRLDLPGRLANLLLLILAQVGEVVNELPRIRRIRNDEAKLEIELADALPFEVVFLHHLHVLNRLLPNRKEHCKTHSFQL